MNIKKIYIFMISIILIIAIFVGVSTIPANDILNSQITAGTNINDLKDLIEDEEISEEETLNDNKTRNEPIKVYSNGYNCLADAYKILDNSKGVKLTMTVDCDTEVFGMGAAKQTINEVIIKSGDYFLRETTAYCTSSLGQNFYKYVYTNDGGENIEIKRYGIKSDKTPNLNSVLEQHITNEEYMVNNIDAAGLTTIFLRSDKSNSELVKFDRVSNKDYYIITFIFDVNKIPEEYTKNIIREGNLDVLKINSLKLTYYIEKTTLYLRKVVKYENYEMTRGITIKVKSNQQYIVNAIDKVYTPQKPY